MVYKALIQWVTSNGAAHWTSSSWMATSSAVSLSYIAYNTVEKLLSFLLKNGSEMMGMANLLAPTYATRWVWDLGASQGPTGVRTKIFPMVLWFTGRWWGSAEGWSVASRQRLVGAATVVAAEVGLD